MNKTEPQWKYLLITSGAIAACLLRMYGWLTVPTDGATWVTERDTVVVSAVYAQSAAEKAGLAVGDEIISVNDHPAAVRLSVKMLYRYFSVGSVVEYAVLRNGQLMKIPVELQSYWSVAPAYFSCYYLLIAYVILVGLVVLFKRPDVPSAITFFAFTQCFAACITGSGSGWDLINQVATTLCTLAYAFVGPTLLHFFLLFPARSRILDRSHLSPRGFYTLALSLGVFGSASFILWVAGPTGFVERVSGVCVGIFSVGEGIIFLAAVVIAFIRIRGQNETTGRGQMRWVMFGMLFGFTPHILFMCVPWLAWYVMGRNMPLFHLILGSGASVFVSTSSLAIFRYRLWDIEPLIKRGLLYAAVTGSMVGVYLVLGLGLDVVAPGHRQSTHITGVAVLALMFIPLRDWLQRRIDRAFHREPYNPALVIERFERSLQGVHDTERLQQLIVKSIDDVLHFKSFGFFTRQDDMTYVPLEVIGMPATMISRATGLSTILTDDLKDSTIVSARELWPESPWLRDQGIELIVPVRLGDQVKGLLLCGQKKSERGYSSQDIQLLTVLAQSAAVFLHVATLYEHGQRASLEFSRQLIDAQEAERKRVAGELHDGLGQELIVIINRAQMILRKPDSSIQQVREIITETSRAIESVRAIAFDLSPNHLGQIGLAESIRSMVENVGQLSNITFAVSCDPIDGLLSKDMQLNVFRIVQECVNNVIKHSNGKSATIELAQMDGDLRIMVCDDGTGFDNSDPSRGGNKGFGLRGLAERTKLLRGSLKIESIPGEGTTLTMMIPIGDSREAGQP